MQQASRISQRAAYFHMGNLVEVDSSNKIFNDPSHPLTTNYISGRIGKKIWFNYVMELESRATL